MSQYALPNSESPVSKPIFIFEKKIVMQIASYNFFHKYLTALKATI